jgi:pimeloyl-ACP methyl ester carboxylesterase/DNA-binding CsgD family transcriptional regulator
MSWLAGMKASFQQRVHYVKSADGVRLAWAESGKGPEIVKASNWLTHLEYEVRSNIWRHWLEFISDHARFIRYDERGSGMSEWNAKHLSIQTWVSDLEAVIEAAKVQLPVTLLGISQGSAACIEYAVRYPTRVKKLIIYGGYARGAWRRGNPNAEREHRAMVDLVSIGWAKDNPVFRQLFTSRFFPGADDEHLRWFNDLCRRSTSAEMATALLTARATVDITRTLRKVRVPTLIIHATNDQVVPVSEGRYLASVIPGSEFVQVDSKNHVLLEHEPAWKRFKEEVLRFLEIQGGDAEDQAFAALSKRERQILTLMSEGLRNVEIGERLGISEKTVRNHTTNLFDKLGVWTRAQAIVLARDRGFKASKQASTQA